jgi:hypothetical protein
MTLLTTLLERIGESKVPRFAKQGFGYRALVVESGEFRRIQNIERRTWNEDAEEVKNVVETLTEHLQVPQGEMLLWPIQAVSLLEIGVYKGGFLPIGVGQGKALISLLSPVVLKAERPLLLVPAQLREQTLQYVIPKMSKHWILHPSLVVKGYEEISLEKNKDFLFDMQPDVIILDECHRCKNRKAGRTRRLLRYFKEHPETNCVAMSGTISKRSIKDWAHIAQWALRDRTPVPVTWNELVEWADAIDEGVPEDKVVHPGVLEQFCNEDENVRQGFRRRLIETPGVVASKEDDLGTSLRIQRISIEVPDKIKKMLLTLRKNWETPNGDIVVNAVDLWRHAREMSLGFWYRWEPTPPRDWLDARRKWKQYVRDVLTHNRRGLDTELQVWNEAKRDGDVPQWHDWYMVKDTYKYEVVTEWEHDFAVEWCAKWAKEGGIIWVSHPPFGVRLAQVTGLPYFGAGDNTILNSPSKSIIASISAHGEGKNLQRYSRNFVSCTPTSGKIWEQLLGRTHRKGQSVDEVTCDVLLHIEELKRSFEQARADAVYLEDTYGNRQKLNYADMV